MLSTKKKMDNAVGARHVRACDSCIKRRARWYCAPDDAFLCQACDSSVHSANPLARRHTRVLLKTASYKSSESFSPSWDRGFTKKARTKRPLKGSKRKNDPVSIVPEIGVDEISHEENEEEQLLYRVPIFDPFVAELCTSTTSNEAATATESKALLADGSHWFFPSEMDLAEFAADVDSLLGKGLENVSFAMKEVGLIDSKEDFRDCSMVNGKVKVEDEESFEPFELSFNYDSPATCGREDEFVKEDVKKSKGGVEYEENTAKTKKKKPFLSLDYEAIISSWATQGSPWTSGGRPDFNPNECWTDCMGNEGEEARHSYGGLICMGGQILTMGDGGREARVSRYREKRRTRLFSKRIRYEVRKLNAEKRPRMKGRFVKRASFLAGPGFPLHNK
ncbi:zinc finger protein CONSTANS-LIKE 16-like isoform X2 [Hibiscus syriacus]|uniref:zinc finger protein CONSTANS-LIKE 16-like isoform X2 n=1 Tax=Hibiscus syriacus TaxID=106335 RepID=UPI001922E867|nr:zinc finger protein CONSTANS-LIKE 16-like isoform X2 [Hibiscus syriacus]